MELLKYSSVYVENVNESHDFELVWFNDKTPIH